MGGGEEQGRQLPDLVLGTVIVLQKAHAQKEVQIGTRASAFLLWVDADRGVGRKILRQRFDRDNTCKARVQCTGLATIQAGGGVNHATCWPVSH